MAGFSLVELMLSLALGLSLSGVMLQALLAEGRSGAQLARLLRARNGQRRVLALVKNDLAQATAVSAAPEQERNGCSLAGRTPVLQMHTPAGPITYTLGAPPSAIWKGVVLMRCGPAYGLHGSLAAGGKALNRVLIDGLDEKPPLWKGCASLLGPAASGAIDLNGSSALAFSACMDSHGALIGLRLMQSELLVAGAPRGTSSVPAAPATHSP